tara:strand:- start:6914 stop:8044 length:1131 start_codon:yes stop_codon:yes gene_type:complete
MKIFNFIKLTKNNNSDVKIGAIGDIVCNHYAEKFFSKNKINPWSKSVIEWVSNLDILLITFDGTFPGSNLKDWEPRVINGENIIDILPRAKNTIINLANNHAFDAGYEGFKKMTDYLDDKGFLWLGAGKSQEDSEKSLNITMNGTEISIVSAAHHGCHPRPPIPSGGQVSRLESQSWWDKIDLYNDKLLIALIHGGVQGSHYPSPKGMQISKQLVDKGADIVLWSHAHVFQSLDRYKGSFICYGLGNAFQTPLNGEIKNSNPNKMYDIGLCLEIGLFKKVLNDVKYGFYERDGEYLVNTVNGKYLNNLMIKINKKVKYKNYKLFWRIYRIYQDVVLKVISFIFRKNLFSQLLSLKPYHFKKVFYNLKNFKDDSIDV